MDAAAAAAEEEEAEVIEEEEEEEEDEGIQLAVVLVEEPAAFSFFAFESDAVTTVGTVNVGIMNAAGLDSVANREDERIEAEGVTVATEEEDANTIVSAKIFAAAALVTVVGIEDGAVTVAATPAPASVTKAEELATMPPCTMLAMAAAVVRAIMGCPILAAGAALLV